MSHKVTTLKGSRQKVYLGDMSVGHEGVQDPEGDVCKQQEGNDLVSNNQIQPTSYLKFS